VVSNQTLLLAIACFSVALLVLFITRWKWNPFLALLLTSLMMGCGAVLLGVSPASGGTEPWSFVGVVDAFQTGLGRTLGSIAPIIVLGAILGRLLAESGGAQVIAQRFTSFFGVNNVVWCIVSLSIVIGLSTWFAVGQYLLLPIMIGLVWQTGKPYLSLAIPMVAFLSMMHALTPPHPGPVVAMTALHADTGKVLLWALVLGIPSATIAGPLFASWIVYRVHPAVPEVQTQSTQQNVQPSFGLTVFTLLLPVILMLGSTLVALLELQEATLGVFVNAIGQPVVAMLVAVLFGLWSLGLRSGRDFATVMQSVEQSAASVGMILLIVGGGGGFGRVLTESGVARELANLAAQWNLPLLLYAWLAAAFIRVATGSSTVAITVAGELVAPALAVESTTSPELLVIVMGFGSLFLSHLNDGGFWVVRDSLELSVKETLQTWTVVVTILAIVGLCLTMFANSLLAWWTS
jgi:gluconate:H+ symporter, GntP family